MALTKEKLGTYLALSNLRNSDGAIGKDDVRGISTGKAFISTKADLTRVNLLNYKVVMPGMFAYVADTSRRGDKISLAYNDSEDSYLVSSISTVFSVSDEKHLLSDYLYIYFNRPEFDRFARFNSWGSARETFDWDTMCNIDIELPSVEIQQKFVNVYKAMVANQKCYENGLSDLKLTCDAYIEDLRRKMPCEKIGPYIEESTTRNSDNTISFVQGVNSDSVFCDSIANLTNVNLANYKVVCPGDFAYNPSRINVGSIAHRQGDDVKCIISPMYIVFRVKTDLLLPDYLMLWLQRKEFFRSTLFYALGSVRDTFDFKLMKEVRIPIPDVHVQQAIVDIYKCYLKRKEINERLKAQIKDLCPILISGSLQEGGKTR